MVVLMAERAAEDLVFGEITTGAADDLAKATDIARQIVTRYGIVPNVGQVVFAEQQSRYLGEGALGIQQKHYSEATAREIDTAMRQLIDEAYTQAKSILEARNKELHGGVELLLGQETITPEEFPALEPAKEARQHTPEHRDAKPATVN
jgi:cell division protease FtsH